MMGPAANSKPSRSRSGSRSGTETRRKERRTTIRWDLADYDELLARADDAGQTVGTHIRACCLSAPKTGARRRASVDLAALAKALAVVNRMGCNLHQIARHLNFHGIPYPDELVTALRGYEQMGTALLLAIGMHR